MLAKLIPVASLTIRDFEMASIHQIQVLARVLPHHFFFQSGISLGPKPKDSFGRTFRLALIWNDNGRCSTKIAFFSFVSFPRFLWMK